MLIPFNSLWSIGTWKLLAISCFGRTFQSILLIGFLRVCPIEPHWRSLIWMLILSSLVLCHKSLFLITCGHCMSMMVCKHLLTKDCNLFEVAFVSLHVSDPYERTDLLLVFNIRSFVFLDMVLDFLTGLRIMKAVLAFPIMYWLARSDPPSLLMLLPRLAKSSTSSIYSPSSSSLSTFLVLILPFVFDLLILRPAFAEIIPFRVSLLGLHALLIV